jgi:hypothetical protein
LLSSHLRRTRGTIQEESLWNVGEENYNPGEDILGGKRLYALLLIGHGSVNTCLGVTWEGASENE